MTIDLTDNAPRISYTVNQGATQTSFTVPFEFFDTTDLKVVLDGTTKTITSHYTVSGGNGSTGTVTMSVTGATGGSTVIIYREIPLSRSTDFPTSGAFPIATLNTELDRTVALFDDRKDRIDRSIRLLDTDDAATMTLPAKASRVGTVLGFNATTGAVEAGPTIANVNSLADITTNINTVGGIASNVTTVAGIQANVTTVAGISSNVSTVAGISSNVTTVAGKASLITSDFAADMALIDSTFVTKMNLVTSDFVTDMAAVTSDFISDMSLVTADFVADVNTLATSDIVSDLNTLATSAIVDDMNLLATSSNVTAMANLGVSSVITNMANLNASGVITNIGTVAGSISNVNTVAAADSNISALNASGVIANIATVAGATSNISTVATNISGVNSFAERYRIASSAPSSSLDAGDLYFDTNTNKLNVYDGSNWASTAEAASRSVTTHTVTSAGTQTISVSYTVGLLAVYLNGLHLSGADYTASNGSSVVITGCSVDDVIDIVALSAFNAANYGTASGKNIGIGNDNVPVFTSGAADNDFLRIDGTSIEGRSASEVLSDIGGQASLTFGIANTNAVKVDSSSVADDEYARFTANGLESRSTSEVLSDIGGLSTSVASSTYAPLAGATFTGEITANGGINEDHNNGALSNSNQTLTLDCHDGNNFSVTTAANITSFVVSNLPASGTAFFFTLKVTYGGSHSITWGSSVKWNAATAPTLSTSGTDIFAFYTIDSGTTIYGFTTGQALA